MFVSAVELLSSVGLSSGLWVSCSRMLGELTIKKKKLDEPALLSPPTDSVRESVTGTGRGRIGAGSTRHVWVRMLLPVFRSGAVGKLFPTQ